MSVVETSKLHLFSSKSHNRSAVIKIIQDINHYKKQVGSKPRMWTRRGWGQNVSVFVHALDIKTDGWGQKMTKFCPRSR